MRALLAVGVVLVLGTVGAVWRDGPEASAPVPPLPALEIGEGDIDAETGSPTPGSAAGSSDVADASAVVSVIGAVLRPGLVTLPAGARIADAVAAAGGHRADADMFGLNWAQKVTDGDQIVVGSTTGDGPSTSSGPSMSAGPSVGAGAAVGTTAPPAGAGVSLNTATLADLDALPGVGPVTATAILAYRDENGPFTSVDQLAEVSGIGPARLEALRSLVTV